MGLFDKFPYSNLHELNTDWIIKRIKEFSAKIDDFATIIEDFRVLDYISQTSDNPVASHAIYSEFQTEINNRQNAIAVNYQAIENSQAAMVTRMDAIAAGLSNRIDGKQDLLTFDTSPRFNSTNPVTSGGIFNITASNSNRIDALETDMPLKLNISDVDDYVDFDHMASTNPVQNKVLAEEIEGLWQQKQHIWMENNITDAVVTLTDLQEYTFYHCETVTSLTATFPAHGEYVIRFTSGATATNLTLTGVTLPDDFTVEANRVYEINVYEGYGLAVSWEASNA